MRRRINDLLRLAGLREEEIRLYLALLKIGRATVAELIAASGLGTMTVYRTIKRLAERGLVSRAKINRKQSTFSPLTLQSLIRTIHAEQSKLRKLELSLQGLEPLLPYLDHADADDDLIDVREGMDAFREEYLKLPDCCAHEYLHIGSMENYWTIAGMGDESPEEASFRAKRYHKGIFARVLDLDSPVMRAIGKRDTKELRTLRIQDSTPIKRDYVGFADNHIAHFVCDAGNPRVLLIRHPELLSLYRSQFAALWEGGRGV